MKKLLTVALLLFFVCLLVSNDLPLYRPDYSVASQNIISTRYRDAVRTAPTWTYSATPTDLLVSYYDYMIGSYNSLPMRLIPPAQGGGYYMAFHGQRTATGLRRAFYGVIDNNNAVTGMNEITGAQNREGYPSLALDPLTSRPLYAWHANADGAVDTNLEVQATWDAISGTEPPVPDTIINNPVTITDPNNITTADNDFVWPVVQMGPSPTAGMRRTYIMGRNSTQHTNPVENIYLAYADYNTAMLDSGQPLTWSYTSIPELNSWNNDTANVHRPFHTLLTGNDGKVFVVGYHTLTVNGVVTFENDLDVFVNTNYGVGTWQHITASSRMVTGNPPTQFGTGPGYFVNASGTPYANDEIFWQIMNSSHLNATIDNNGVIHMIGVWHLANSDNSYYQTFNSMKEITFNSTTNAFAIREIYPKAGSSSDNLLWKPWDADGNGTVDAYDPTSGNPVMTGDWNYPHWDETAESSAMQFHYNNQKITYANTTGQMAAVWQNSYKAKLYNQGGNAAYAAYATVPEIFISVSPNYGQDWSDPIIINSVDVPSFSGNRPMWVYPADKIKSAGTIGKLGLMFYHDNTWGSAVVNPGPTMDGGIVKYMALDIDFASLNPTGISGFVLRNDNNQPLPNATVTVGTVSTTTDATGFYLLGTPAGTLSATATKIGYNPQTINNISVTPNLITTVNFALTSIPVVTVSGTVTGGVPAEALQGATVTLTGIQTHTSTSTATGAFSLSDVLTNQTYQYDISKPGYESATGSITVGTTNYLMGTIHLNEPALPPLNVSAQIATDNNSVLISWNSPAMRSLLFQSAGQRDTDRSLLGFQVWRLLSGQETNESLWTSLATVAPATLSYSDNNWLGLPTGTYRYAVKAQYSTPAWSLPVFSNSVTRYTNGNLIGMVRDLSNNPLDNASITLTATPPNGHGPYTVISNPTGNYSVQNAWYGTYTVDCTRDGFQLFIPANVLVIANQIMSFDIVLLDSLNVPSSPAVQINVENTIATVTWQAPAPDNSRSLIGYKVWRLLSSQETNPEQWTLLTPSVISAWFYPDNGWATLVSGSYKYAVKAVYSGLIESAPVLTPAVDKVVGNPEENNLSAQTPSLLCYPNPFTACTTISMQIPKADVSTLKIYNVKGALVKTLCSEYQSTGTTHLFWDGTDDQGKICSGGLYFCRMTTGKHHLQTKLVLFR